MKVLWLCNIVLPELSNMFGLRKTVAGGWLDGLWNCLIHKEELEMAICVPIIDRERRKDGIFKNYKYFSVPRNKDMYHFCSEQQSRFEEILDDFQPDIIHIWGTEYTHAYTMVNACENKGMLGKTLVNIQGLVSFCAHNYCLGIEGYLIALGDDNSIQVGKNNFIKNGEYEKKVLQKVQYVIGRTEWDKACCLQINHNLKYLYCGEILRDVFYERKDKWNWDKCQKHSIFISQAGYPVKGFHLIINELAILKEQYPDLCVYVAGNKVLEDSSEYGNYIADKIAGCHLQDTVQFVGQLTAEDMYEYYLKANVFLSTSTIENSSNSICEAQMIGVPVVSSYVGGIVSLIEHGMTGYYYPLNESYMMQHYVEEIFDNQHTAQEMSEKEIEKANVYNNRNQIVERMMQIYSSI